MHPRKLAGAATARQVRSLLQVGRPGKSLSLLLAAGLWIALASAALAGPVSTTTTTSIGGSTTTTGTGPTTTSTTGTTAAPTTTTTVAPTTTWTATAIHDIADELQVAIGRIDTALRNVYFEPSALTGAHAGAGSS